MDHSAEVERTKALFQDAIKTFAEPATSYSEAEAAGIVLEALRLYRRALEASESRPQGDAWLAPPGVL